MSRFSVGQKVRVVHTCPTLARYIGQIGTVTALFHPVSKYEVLMDCDGQSYGADDKHIEPLRDDDSRELTTWESVRAITGYVPGEAVRG